MGHSTQTTAPRRLVRSNSARRVLLRVVHSPDANRIDDHFDLSGADKSWVFGRSGPGAIIDLRLSRQHCRVSAVEGGIRLEDLGSRNGCFVQGRRVVREYLHPNNVVRLGDTLLVVDEEPPPDQVAPPTFLDARVPEIIGESYATSCMRGWLAAAAPTAGSVLLLGPTGSGKEVAARALHRLSERRGPFVAVNCGAIAPELADSELFGHRKGAFTGAHETRPGLLVEAHGGTLFLDEVGDLPPPLQVKLLRALQERTVRAVGDTGTREIDIRVIAATNVDLEKSGFRDDLRARLSQWVIELSSLAERRADILTLARHLIRRQTSDRASAAWTPEFAEALLLHDWPLNVRELENLVGRLCAHADVQEWDLLRLPSLLQKPLIERDAEADSVEPPSRDELERALADARGVVSRVAEKYGRDRTQVYRWIRRLGIDPEAHR
jgi:DNA-binding NtrC family response regulator